MANFPGTAGNDTYAGTADPDTISDGGGGSDTLAGAGGNDVFTVTGAGNDTVDGGVGVDTLNINFSASTGNFNITAGSGFRYLTDFSTFSVGWRNVENLNIQAGSGNDTVSTGNDGYDVISGNAGDDTLDTGKGLAVVSGGVGSDRWTVDFTNNATAITLNLALAGAQVLANGSRFASIERLTLLAGDGADIIRTLVGAPNVQNNDVIDGGGGNDLILVGGGADIVRGGDGVDTLYFSVGSDTGNFGMTSGSGLTYFTDFSNTSVGFVDVERFDLTLGAGNDSVVMGDDIDVARGGDGDDTLNTLRGSAVVNGGAGNDRWAADFSESTLALNLDINLVTSNPQAGSSIAGIESLTLTGSALADVIKSTNGEADLQYNDTINGHDGDDTITVGSGQDIVVGGPGNDLLIIDYADEDQAFGMTSGSGYIYITDFSNTNVGWTEIERLDVRLGLGADIIQTGDGVDSVNGGGGADSLDTRRGAATVVGGDGEDRWLADFTDVATPFALNINLANSSPLAGTTVSGIEMLTLSTGAGADTIVSSVGAPDLARNDTLNTGAGNDTITVGGGLDTVDGGDGLDVLIFDVATNVGNFGMTTAGAFLQISDFSNTNVSYRNIERFDVRLGLGNDTVVLGDDFDRASGGAGNDDINTRRGAAVVDGGAGLDIWRADFSNFAAPLNLNLDLATTTPTAGSSVTNIEAVAVTGTAGNDVIRTKTGSPDLAYNDTINGGAGLDLITVGGGLDTVDGGLGNDLLVINWATDIGNFGMTTSGGNVQISDFSNTNVTFRNIERFDVTLGSGNDNVVLGDGIDTIRGGAGNDILDTRKGAAAVYGGSGVDRWSADYSNSAVALNFNLNLATTNPTPTSLVTEVEQITLTATSFADTIVTRIAPELAYNDTIVAGAGDDVITVGGGSDTVDGGDGFDTLIIDYSGDTEAFGNTSSGEYLTISDFSDTSINYRNIERIVFATGAANDTVSGSEGDDTLNTGGGTDTLNGLNGNDTLIGGAGGDILNGGEGFDTASYAGSDAGVTVNLLADTASGGHAAGDNLNDVENVSGSSFNDVLSGNGSANVLNGGAGDDVLFGDAGNDRLEGGVGADALNGGVGLDAFVYRAIGESTVGVAGRDVINAFTTGQDIIDLRLIDANTVVAGDQAFTFGALANGTPGRLAVVANGAGSWLVEGDVTGDGVADFAFVVGAVAAPVAADFQL